MLSGRDIAYDHCIMILSNIPSLSRHNLNMAHSGGLDGRPYSDHTCLVSSVLRLVVTLVSFPLLT